MDFSMTSHCGGATSLDAEFSWAFRRLSRETRVLIVSSNWSDASSCRLIYSSSFLFSITVLCALLLSQLQLVDVIDCFYVAILSLYLLWQHVGFARQSRATLAPFNNIPRIIIRSAKSWASSRTSLLVVLLGPGSKIRSALHASATRERAACVCVHSCCVVYCSQLESPNEREFFFLLLADSLLCRHSIRSVQVYSFFYCVINPWRLYVWGDIVFRNATPSACVLPIKTEQRNDVENRHGGRTGVLVLIGWATSSSSSLLLLQLDSHSSSYNNSLVPPETKGKEKSSKRIDTHTLKNVNVTVCVCVCVVYWRDIGVDNLSGTPNIFDRLSIVFISSADESGETNGTEHSGHDTQQPTGLFSFFFKLVSQLRSTIYIWVFAWNQFQNFEGDFCFLMVQSTAVA